jgi:hypothetical protein
MSTTTLQILTGTLLLASAALRANEAGFTAEEEQLASRLSLSSLPWAGVRWEVSLTEARARAAKEGKPVFLVVNTGNVLGFV